MGFSAKDWFNISFDGDTHFGDGFWYEGWEGNRDLVSSTCVTPLSSIICSLPSACGSTSWASTACSTFAYGLDRDFIESAFMEASPANWGRKRASMAARAMASHSSARSHGDYNLIVNDEDARLLHQLRVLQGPVFGKLRSMNMFEIAHSAPPIRRRPWCIYQGKHLVSFARQPRRLAPGQHLDRRHLRPAYGVLFGMPGILPVLRQQMGTTG